MAKVDVARRKLEAVRKGELWPLTAGEKARLAVHIGRGASKVVRGKSTKAPDRAADRVLEDAEERLKAEYDALEGARKQAIRDKAKAKVEKGSGFSWW
ncbi:hypothetical protein AB0L75_42420 [Streptomyces sp. NPDC052101]|uniref:DUF6257 family protein n=1 Tax=Streptomyces sp. NPDC052101 TaxID=3155763 RepID=UPI0034136EE2